MINFGIVQSVSDPKKLGRVKVKVFNAHDNIETKDLPWSQVMMGANTPAVNGTGHSVNLAIGSLVVGMFLDAQWQEFIVMGSLPTKTDVTTDDDTDIGGSEAETTNDPDNNARVRAEVDPTADDIKGTYEPASAYAPVYPYNNVYETESGHVKEYDDTPGYERIKERHKSGTQYEIQPNGSKIEKIVRDNYQLVVGHDTLEVRGNVKIIVSGDANIAVAKNLTAQVGQDMTTIVGGNMEANITGNALATIAGTTTVLNTGDMNLTVSGKDSANLTIKSQYSVAEAAGSTTIHKGEIKLDGNVTVTGTSKLIGETRIADDTITLDNHTHGSNNVNQANTAGPNTN